MGRVQKLRHWSFNLRKKLRSEKALTENCFASFQLRRNKSFNLRSLAWWRSLALVNLNCKLSDKTYESLAKKLLKQLENFQTRIAWVFVCCWMIIKSINCGMLKLANIGKRLKEKKLTRMEIYIEQKLAKGGA